ncbi:MAG: restriction endonuclease subunit S, partial [bacterium]|nr:restriction endonuclease subunit S [bacterium]
MEKLPEGWIITELENCVQILDKHRVPINSRERLARIQGIKEEDLFPYYGATGQVGLIDDFLLDGVFVLLGEDGAPFLESAKRKAYIVNGKIWVNNHAHVLKSLTSNQLLCHYLNQFDYTNYVTGTTRLKLTQSSLKRLPIKFPPLAEQHRIGARLDAITPRLDALRERLDRIPEIIKRFRQAVLTAAVTGKLTEKWRAKHPDSSSRKAILKDIVTKMKIGPFGTMLHKADYINGGIPIINPAHIREQRISINPNLTVSREKYNELNNYILAENDIILGRRGEMGRCAIITTVESGWLCGTGSLFMTPAPCVFPRYLLFCLSSEDVKRYLVDSSSGTTMNNLNLRIVNNIEISLPPLAEQREIVRQVDRLFSLADTLDTHYQKAKATLDKMPQSVLAKAFSGKLVPTEAQLARSQGREYETAQQLLQ